MLCVSTVCPTRAQVIKRFIMSSKKTAFIVEHDFIMAAYLADRVIVYDGQPSVEVSTLLCLGRMFSSPFGPRRLPHDAMPLQSQSGPYVAGLCTLAAIAADGHERFPEEPGHHVPTRPHELPASNQQAGLRQGS